MTGHPHVRLVSPAPTNRRSKSENDQSQRSKSSSTTSRANADAHLDVLTGNPTLRIACTSLEQPYTMALASQKPVSLQPPPQVAGTSATGRRQKLTSPAGPNCGGARPSSTSTRAVTTKADPGGLP